jgi:predicted outer membrane protein
LRSLLLRTVLFASAAIFCGASGPAFAQDRPVDPQRAVVERADAAAKEYEEEEITDPTVFVKSAALGAIMQVELAKLAESSSRDATVKGFAARMLKEHGALQKDLAAVAKRKRLDVPTALVYEDERKLGEGADKSEAEFDAWYTGQIATELLKSMALFRAAAKMEDPDLSAFAKKALGVLEAQQKTAAAQWQ